MVLRTVPPEQVFECVKVTVNVNVSVCLCVCVYVWRGDEFVGGGDLTHPPTRTGEGSRGSKSYDLPRGRPIQMQIMMIQNLRMGRAL